MLQSKNTQIYAEVKTDNIGFQFDSRDGEIFLEEGYKYLIHSVVGNTLIKTELDLTEVNNDN